VLQRLVEPGQFTGDQHPVTGHLIAWFQVVEQPVCFDNSDRGGDPARCQLDQHGVEANTMCCPELGHVAVTFHQQSQNSGIGIRPDVGHPIRTHRSYRNRAGIVGVVLV
jgi:hypothetical protein